MAEGEDGEMTAAIEVEIVRWILETGETHPTETSEVENVTGTGEIETEIASGAAARHLEEGHHQAATFEMRGIQEMRL